MKHETLVQRTGPDLKKIHIEETLDRKFLQFSLDELKPATAKIVSSIQRRFSISFLIFFFLGGRGDTWKL